MAERHCTLKVNGARVVAFRAGIPTPWSPPLGVYNGQIKSGRIRSMKYLMSMSVALAIAMPAWAQTTTPPAQTPAVTPSGHHHPTTRHHVFRPRSQDNSADNLNAQELTVLQSAGSTVQRMPTGGKQLTDPNR
jgi:hypothetical protein